MFKICCLNLAKCLFIPMAQWWPILCRAFSQVEIGCFVDFGEIVFAKKQEMEKNAHVKLGEKEMTLKRFTRWIRGCPCKGLQ